MGVVEYSVFKVSDAGEVVRLLARSFCAAEPPAVAVGLSSAELERFVSLVCPKAATDGPTIVARELESRQIAGVLLTDDFASPLEVNPEQISHKFRPIFAMLGSLDEEYQRAEDCDG